MLINQDFILEATCSQSIKKIDLLQSLWSDYGQLLRIELMGTDCSTVIVKHIDLSSASLIKAHPRGWNTNHSHQRKMASYKVEANWYKQYSNLCQSSPRVADCLGVYNDKKTMMIVLEDLDSQGFPKRFSHVSPTGMLACIRWLAQFHARFLNFMPRGLWQHGSYWHLATRPDELNALTDESLKMAAPLIDKALRNCPFQTLIHGDAKIANFCFSNDVMSVAAVDFQYVGGGCGMSDIAYFLGSCLSGEECEKYTDELLDSYFNELRQCLKNNNFYSEAKVIESIWRPLYPVAWADFHRFLKGWNKTHKKLTYYSERITQDVINMLLP